MRIKTLVALATAAAVLIAAAPGAPAARPLNVVATTPDLAALARAIGGDAVDVKALAKPTEDPHFVDAKPSHILTLNRADMLIDGGAELEMGWLPALLESARNTKLAAGAPGRVNASEGIHLLEVPTSFDRSRGDVHALGNPHFMLDPVNVRTVAKNIADHLAKVDAPRAAQYQSNLAAFLAQLDAKLPQWQSALAPYAGARIVTYHRDFVYLAERFKLAVIETLEPKPGIAPSPSHLAEVITAMKAQHARVIVVQPFQNRRTAETVARQTQGIVTDISQQPGAMPGTDTYFTLMDNIVGKLAKALSEAK